MIKRSDYMLRRICAILFPNALNVNKSWLYGAMWIFLGVLGLSCVSNAYQSPNPDILGREILTFCGAFTTYVATNVNINKMILNNWF